MWRFRAKVYADSISSVDLVTDRVFSIQTTLEEQVSNTCNPIYMRSEECVACVMTTPPEIACLDGEDCASKALITDDRYQACVGTSSETNKPCSTSPSTCKDCILKKRSTCSFECGQMSLYQESKLPSYREIQSFWNVTSSELYHTKVLHKEEDKCIRAMSPKRILFKVSGDATPEELAYWKHHTIRIINQKTVGHQSLRWRIPTNPDTTFMLRMHPA